MGAVRRRVAAGIGRATAVLFAAGDMAGLKQALTHSARLLLASLCVGLAFVLVAGQWLIAILFGEPFATSWQPLVILTAAQVLTAFFGLGRFAGGGSRRQPLGGGPAVSM